MREEAKRLESAAPYSVEDCTVAELYVSWRDMTGPNQGWTDFTYETYDGMINSHVPSTFLARTVRTIRLREVQVLMSTAGESVGRDRQRKLLSLLRRMFDQAVVEEYADANPAASVSAAATAVVTKEQVRTAGSKIVVSLGDALRIAAAHDPFYRPFAYTVVYTGRRISELVVLNVEDFDSIHGTLRVSKAQNKGYTAENGRREVNGTKTGRARSDHDDHRR